MLHLAAGLPSEAGPLGLEKAVAAKLKRTMIMELRDSGAVSEMGGSRIWIDTTSPVDLAKAAAFIELSPAVKFTVEPKDGGFAIAGDFKPQERIKVTVRKGLPSAGGKGPPGGTLAADWSRAFIFPISRRRCVSPARGGAFAGRFSKDTAGERQLRQGKHPPLAALRQQHPHRDAQ
ncbi:MAG: hypothetical protein ACLUEQ_05025 [Cloacibacillus evryensis]